jgi:outer membrane protein assembly factor BamA
VLEHVAVTGGSLITQYARNTTSRFELSAGYQNYSFYRESRSLLDNSDTMVLPAPAPLGLGNASIAYVGDDATMGFTSPIAGARFRFEATPTVGSLNYQTYLADMRRYAYMKPFTFALRGLHFGRYGRDGDSQRIGSVFLGDPTLVRGYSYDSFNATECTQGSGSLAESSCAQFDRLLGSRVGIFNAELRLQVFGQYGMGLFDAPLPLEIAPFFDAGVAWTGASAPNLTFDANSSDRTPVMSAGITSRLNLFGFAIFEIFHARPFNRPGRGGVWGFSLQPGW